MVTKIAFTYAIAGTSKGDVMSLNDPDYAQTGDTYLLGALGGNDKIEIFNANVTVSGGSGDDSILLHAGGGSSYVSGDSGHDSITSYRNGVVLNGDIGNDTITSYAIEVKSVGGLGNDVFVVGGDYNTVSGGAGNDVVILSSKASTSPITADVLAGANNDVTLDTGNDIAYVLTSNNTISGGMGSDTIIVAGGHDDVIYGDSGNDTFFFASVDNVTVTGGVGADRYVFGSYTPIALPGTVVPQVVREDLSLMDNIHITDFAKGKDKIDLSAYGVHFKDISVDSNQFLVSNGSQGVILDVTLDGYTHAITASDFIGLIA